MGGSFPFFSGGEGVCNENQTTKNNCDEQLRTFADLDIGLGFGPSRKEVQTGVNGPMSGITGNAEDRERVRGVFCPPGTGITFVNCSNMNVYLGR
jgi:hypothetical protein